MNLTFVRFGGCWLRELFSPNQLILYHIVTCLSSFSPVQTFKVLAENVSVFKVVGVGLQLICIMVLEPQVIACCVAGNFVAPTVAVALDGVLAAVGVELVCNHLLTFRCCCRESNFC